MNKTRTKFKGETLFFSIFAIVGLFLIIVGFFLFIDGLNFRKTAVDSTAVITNITSYKSGKNTHHNVYIDYIYEGEEYNDISLNYYSSGMRRGQTIKIMIDPNDPYDVRTGGLFYVPFIMLWIMGLVFGLVGIIPIIVSRRRIARNKFLLENGQCLRAIFEGFRENRNVSFNHKHPFNLICRYTDEFTGTQYRFKSNNLWITTFYENDGNGTMQLYVNVYVMPGDYSKYYVDADTFLDSYESSSNVIDFT